MPKPVISSQSGSPQREFHVSREARDRYGFDEVFFSLSGSVIFASFRTARQFAQQINDQRDLISFPEQAVQASELYAMGLIDEILHYIIQLYQEERNLGALEKALTHLEETLGHDTIDQVLRTFIREFPPVAVYKGEMTPSEYLREETSGVSNRAVALEELLLLRLTNENPAAEPFEDLIDDEELEATTAYDEMVKELEDFFEAQPRFGPDDQSLVTMLRSPSKASPRSWQGQLAYMRSRWFDLIGPYAERLLTSADFLEEEQRPFFGPGPGPAEIYEFAEFEAEPERFSRDLEWMPRVVMLAKNVYVWLHQLSERYGREMTHLDDIPDEELDRLRRRGFTALWLIGLWERSAASRRIKQMMGNPEAVASAYSLSGYWIAHDLGGEPAFEDLKARAWQRGIRMASDMVPNHMGIDSDWVINHPDWFIGLDYSPFPSYTFTGPDLCADDRVGVYIEDGYYDHSDAAVVFKRLDHWTGGEKYIYHGNDGTQMPWNDTAQLNYLKEEVREAVIQTILDVARRSPIIRFDAAMTLAKRHYQRLWFPEPGSGGTIPSRAEFGLTKEQFDEAMPEEFWRQVVDRVAEEVPETLLLAEAFWLMEGYFVRTLGMHRVYNSAFMNMLRDEKNAEYRQVMKNTLEFDPEVLRRYVNFLNNPDERTAVDQFGKGDKYFGVCTLMVTMPGLPMFGHGQIQGFAEKYGMEYQRSYWDESPDQYLIERHERQIFPLHHKRYLFAGVENFFLYDFVTPSGTVDENVFAYSNRRDGERALVMYHNRYGDTRGWIRSSVASARKDEEGNQELVQTSFAEGLNIPDDPNRFLIFRDFVDDLEYIRNCHDLVAEGLYVDLRAYKCYVFVDFREVTDGPTHRYGDLAAHLDGRGVPDMEEALRELALAPLHQPLRNLLSAPVFRWLLDHRAETPDDVDDEMLSEVEAKIVDILKGVEAILPQDVTIDDGLKAELAADVRQKLAILLSAPASIEAAVASEVEVDAGSEVTTGTGAVLGFFCDGWDGDDMAMWGALFGWLSMQPMGALVDAEIQAELSRSFFDEWLVAKLIRETLQDLDVTDDQIDQAIATIRMLLSYPSWAPDTTSEDLRPYNVLQQALRDRDVQTYLRINRYEDVLWYHRESFARWLWWMVTAELLEARTDEERPLDSTLMTLDRLVEQLVEADAASGYRVDKLLDATES